MKLKYKCAICKKPFETLVQLTHHIPVVHNYTIEKYYEKYVRKENEGICPICGNKTKFLSFSLGYSKHCSTKCSNNDPETKKKYEKTCLDKYGVPHALMNEDIKERQRKGLEKNGGYTLQRPKLLERAHKAIKDKYGSEYYLQTKKGQKVFKNTCNKHFGKDNPQQVKEIKQKTENTNVEKYGYKVPTQNKKILKKVQKTTEERYGVKSILCDRELMIQCYIDKYGVDNPFKAQEVKDKIKEFYINELGVSHPMKDPEEFKRRMQARLKKNHGYLSRTEYLFSRKLKKNNIEFENEYFIKEGNIRHHFDFAILQNGKLKCLVEIDGRFWHGLIKDNDGHYSNGRKDYLRWNIVPKGVKFLVIDDNKLKEGFKELQRILPMKYKDWKKEMLKSIPKNIEDAIPKFSKKRIKIDFNSLCEYTYNKNAFLGNSILLNFCKSRIVETLGDTWKEIRKTLYKSPYSSHPLLEGFDIFKNPSKLREKFRKKYKGVKEVIVKHHSPEKMLAICSLGKTYISKEPIDKESKRIIKFLNLKAYEI